MTLFPSSILKNLILCRILYAQSIEVNHTSIYKCNHEQKIIIQRHENANVTVTRWDWLL